MTPNLRARYATAAPAVVAPKPVQTRSRRAETHGPNSDFVQWTDRADIVGNNPNKKSFNWASDDEDDTEPNKTSGPVHQSSPTCVSTSPASLQKLRVSNPRTSCWGSPSQKHDQAQYPPPTLSEETSIREVIKKPDTAGKKLEQQKEVVLPLALIKRSSQADEISSAYKERPWSSMDEKNSRALSQPAREHATDLNTKHLKPDANIDSQQDQDVEIPSPSWEDDTDEEELDDDEKERRHQQRALEQQQLILKQVAAARASKRHPPSPVITKIEQKHESSRVTAETEEDISARLCHQRQRPPRTAGVLFKRLANGLLVRIDRNGNPLEKQQNEYPTNREEVEKDETLEGKNADEEAHDIIDQNAKRAHGSSAAPARAPVTMAKGEKGSVEEDEDCDPDTDPETSEDGSADRALHGGSQRKKMHYKGKGKSFNDGAAAQLHPTSGIQRRHVNSTRN